MSQKWILFLTFNQVWKCFASVSLSSPIYSFSIPIRFRSLCCLFLSLSSFLAVIDCLHKSCIHSMPLEKPEKIYTFSMLLVDIIRKIKKFRFRWLLTLLISNKLLAFWLAAYTYIIIVFIFGRFFWLWFFDDVVVIVRANVCQSVRRLFFSFWFSFVVAADACQWFGISFRSLKVSMNVFKYLFGIKSGLRQWNEESMKCEQEKQSERVKRRKRNLK